jgi:hypothetical protein
MLGSRVYHWSFCYGYTELRILLWLTEHRFTDLRNYGSFYDLRIYKITDPFTIYGTSNYGFTELRIILRFTDLRNYGSFYDLRIYGFTDLRFLLFAFSTGDGTAADWSTRARDRCQSYTTYMYMTICTWGHCYNYFVFLAIFSNFTIIYNYYCPWLT